MKVTHYPDEETYKYKIILEPGEAVILNGIPCTVTVDTELWSATNPDRSDAKIGEADSSMGDVAGVSHTDQVSE